MSESTTGNEIDPNGVNHPAHYNMDPSGVECIEVARYLGFDVGNAYKYVMRAGIKDSKGDPLAAEIKDLKKAIWYLEDTFAKQVVPMLPIPFDIDVKMTMIAESRHGRAREFFNYIKLSYTSDTLDNYFWFLRQALGILEEILKHSQALQLGVNLDKG
jgi:hypothetical protein